jgi:hypothetical protein
VIAVQVATARQAVGLLQGAHRRGMTLVEGREVVVTSTEPTVPVGIDGESVHLSTPVRCAVRPGALRVRLPRERPGVRPPQARLDWAALWSLALGRPPTVAAASPRDDPTTPPAGSPGRRDVPGPRQPAQPEQQPQRPTRP